MKFFQELKRKNKFLTKELDRIIFTKRNEIENKKIIKTGLEYHR